MDKHTEKERALVEQLHHFQPRPSQNAYDRMAKMPWRVQSERKTLMKTAMNSHSVRLALTTVAAAVITVSVIWVTPPLHSLAQEVLNTLFNRASSSTITVETQVSSDQAEPSRMEPAQVEALAGFTLKQPSSIPSGYTFGGAGYTASRHAASLFYQRPGAELLITQQPAAYAEYGLLTDGDSGIGPDAPIEQVTIGNVLGEYVAGTWVMSSDNQAVWLPDASVQRLRWQEGDMIYEILANGGSADTGSGLDRDAMIALANSLQ
ncbi:MAG: hypothetical protein SF029_09195 [bacterium]|nr:hypothetical protein [bacterium]